MHTFHYWITGVGKQLNMSENGVDEFSLRQRISATSRIPMVHNPTLLDFSSFSFSYIRTKQSLPTLCHLRNRLFCGHAQKLAYTNRSYDMKCRQRKVCQLFSADICWSCVVHISGLDYITATDCRNYVGVGVNGKISSLNTSSSFGVKLLVR